MEEAGGVDVHVVQMIHSAGPVRTALVNVK